MNDVCFKCDCTYGKHQFGTDNCPNPEGSGFTNNVFTIAECAVKVVIDGKERIYQCKSISNVKPLQEILGSLGYTVTVV